VRQVLRGHGRRSLPFDTEKDFVAVGLVNRSFVQPYPEEQHSLDAAQKYVRDEIVFWGRLFETTTDRAALALPRWEWAPPKQDTVMSARYKGLVKPAPAP
jgi:hypothetical protein